MDANAPARPIEPAHIRAYPLAYNAAIVGDPYERIIPALHEGPDLFYARDCHPAHAGIWILTRTEAMRAVYLDNEHFTARGTARISALLEENWDLLPIESDPPEHTAYRTLLQPLFSPSRVATLATDVAAASRQLHGALREPPEFDFVRDFAQPFPLSIILTLLGLPLKEMTTFLAWGAQLFYSSTVEVRRQGARHIKEYMASIVAQRRRHPGTDLLSSVANAQVGGAPPG